MPKRCVLLRPIGKGKYKKYYGILDKKGEPKSVQEYKLCSSRDQKRSSKAEREAR